MAVCIAHREARIGTPDESGIAGSLADEIEFQSEEERIGYLVQAFPELVKYGKFAQAMQLAVGREIPCCLYRLVNTTSIWLTRSAESLAEHFIHGSKTISEREQNRYPTDMFLRLIKARKFVDAIELVHAKGSFSGIYGLYDRVANWFACKIAKGKTGENV